MRLGRRLPSLGASGHAAAPAMQQQQQQQQQQQEPSSRRALEVALQVPVVQWTVLCSAGGLCVSRLWRQYALMVAPDSLTMQAEVRRLCRRHAWKLPLPPLPRLTERWWAEQRLRHLEACDLEIAPVYANSLVKVEVILGGDRLWHDGIQPYPTMGTRRCHCSAMAVLQVGSQFAYTSQASPEQPVLGPQAPEQLHCPHRLRLGDLWRSWLGQFRQRLRLPLQERVPFRFPKQPVWDGRVLCDLRMPHGKDQWAYLRVSTQDSLVMDDSGV